MKLISVNVGKPKSIEWKGNTFKTGIFKYPVQGIQKVSFLNIEGDQQADLRFHGGRDKAVYSYDNNYYKKWKASFRNMDFPIGVFGENLTTEGLLEHEVYAGNIYQIGSVLLQAIQPRIPCFKLNIRFQEENMITHFYNIKRHGIYFRVLREGLIEAGNDIKLVERSPYSITIADIAMSFTSKGENQRLLRQVLDFPLLPDGIKKNLIAFQRK